MQVFPWPLITWFQALESSRKAIFWDKDIFWINYCFHLNHTVCYCLKKKRNVSFHLQKLCKLFLRLLFMTTWLLNLCCTAGTHRGDSRAAVRPCMGYNCSCAAKPVPGWRWPKSVWVPLLFKECVEHQEATNQLTSLAPTAPSTTFSLSSRGEEPAASLSCLESQQDRIVQLGKAP